MRDTLIEEILPTGAKAHTRILAVGSLDEWNRRYENVRIPMNIRFVDFHEVTPALLELLHPEAVVSPALARNFDCIDLACLLDSLDYRGVYCATAYGLPNPRLIENEISELCPGLNFQIIAER